MIVPAPVAKPSAITSDGCWADYRTPRDLTRDRPCLFLDRDGVLIEDTGYPHVPADIVPISEALRAVAAAQRAGAVIGIVSNQSGVGRGYFGWEAFAAVQAVIDGELAARGARLDFVLACPHLPDAAVPLLRGDHPWRKPQPGMLLAAHDALGIDLGRSAMLGDKDSDMAAADGAGITARWLFGPLSAREPKPDGIRRIGRDALEACVESAFAAPHACP